MINSENLPRVGGIYQIRNIHNGKSYIGSSNNLKRRHVEHISKLRCGKGSLVLQRAWEKYGSSCFEILVLEVCPESNHKHLLEREQYYIDTIHPEYNAYPLACGVLVTDEFRKKVKDGLHRKFSPVEFAERALKMRISAKEKGTFQSQNFKDGQSKRTKGFWEREDYRSRQLSNPNRGNYKLSEQDVRKIRKMHEIDKISNEKISKEFGVSKNTIQAITSYRNWKSLK